MIDIKTVSYAYTVTNILGPKLCLATNKLFLQVAMTSVFSVFLPRLSVSLFSSSLRQLSTTTAPFSPVIIRVFFYFLAFSPSVYVLLRFFVMKSLPFVDGEFSAIFSW